MNKDEIKHAVEEIFRDVLDNNTLRLEDHLTAADVEGWDSLTHINLVGSIEKHFRIRFSLGELDELKNVGEMLGAIERKINK